MTTWQIEKIASEFNLSIVGDKEAMIDKVSDISEQSVNGLTWLKNEEFLHYINCGTILINEKHFSIAKKGVNYLITDEHPKLVFSKILKKYFTPAINYYLVNEVEKHLKNNKITIGDNVFIGQNVQIGDGTVIYPNVVIEADSIIGKSCIIKSQVSIGTEGMGLELNSETNLLEKFPQIGNTVLEDFVEIGPNSTVRRGALKTTIIRRGSKVGSLSNIGHNCDIGENCILTSGIILSGSSKIGNNVFMGVNSCVRNGIHIGKDATLGMGSVVVSEVKDGVTVYGNPAKPK